MHAWCVGASQAGQVPMPYGCSGCKAVVMGSRRGVRCQALLDPYRVRHGAHCDAGGGGGVGRGEGEMMQMMQAAERHIACLMGVMPCTASCSSSTAMS